MRWIRVLFCALLLVPTLAACSLVRGGGSSPPSPSLPQPEARDREPEDEGTARITSAIVETALGAIGTPYAWGGNGRNGFDCSGLIQYAYGQHGIQLPRISTAQLREGREIEPDLRFLSAGDILGFSGEAGGKSTHVGLYVGNGDFIHSSSSGVRISDLAVPYWKERLMEARRIVR